MFYAVCLGSGVLTPINRRILRPRMQSAPEELLVFPKGLIVPTNRLWQTFLRDKHFIRYGNDWWPGLCHQGHIKGFVLLLALLRSVMKYLALDNPILSHCKQNSNFILSALPSWHKNRCSRSLPAAAAESEKTSQ